MEAVLATPELVELILLQLEMTTILTIASLVNKTWHSLITTSPSLQQTLFFKPVPTSASSTSSTKSQSLGRNESECRKSSSPNPVLVNPLLVKKFGPLFFEPLFFDMFHEIPGLHVRRKHYGLPWSRQRITHMKDVSRGTRDQIAGTERDAAEVAAQRQHFTWSGSSWREMLISQPPLHQLAYRWEDRNRNTMSVDVMESRSSDGLRMGQLYDMVQQRVGPEPSHSVWFRVVWFQPKEPSLHGECSALAKLKIESTHELTESTIVVVDFCSDEPTHLRRNREALFG